MMRLMIAILSVMASVMLCPPGFAQADVTAPSPAPSYRLGIDDKLRIVVYGETQLTGEYVIGSEGTVALPLIGAVKAAGLTVSEFQGAITQAFGSSYIADPKISVDIVAYRPFYILGEVNKAGQYPYRIGMTVLRAVATAEGFSYRANKKKVAIQGADGMERIVPLTAQTLVQPGDTIRVLERYF